MFYRRKIILSILQLFEGKLDKIRLQKLLFLFTQRQTKSVYDFIPYRFGCFSYSANADMTAMVTRGFLTEDEKSFTKLDPTDYLKQLNCADLNLLQDVKSLFGKMSPSALMKHTYLNYPFYAIKSEVAKKILTKEELEKVNESKPSLSKTVLFTIGYESISLEEYLNRLIKNDVKVLVDVRNNPLSMKFGFSKNQLIKYCGSIGIQYIHIPEVGILSKQRQELNTQSDYDMLFSIYRKNNLPKSIDSQIQILNLLKVHKRVALTCFEANIYQCHRKHLAEAIENHPDFEFEVKHI
ncbi:MAG TPA: DUF488 domain-containing protein [Ignavibacteria bacterium]|nr:DUF488 domain-containing protein [Ignavibacteria bacterium]